MKIPLSTILAEYDKDKEFNSLGPQQKWDEITKALRDSEIEHDVSADQLLALKEIILPSGTAEGKAPENLSAFEIAKGGLASDFAKSGVNTVTGIGKSAAKLLRPPFNAVQNYLPDTLKLDKNYKLSPGTNAPVREEDIKPEGTAENVGSFLGDALQLYGLSAVTGGIGTLPRVVKAVNKLKSVVGPINAISKLKAAVGPTAAAIGEVVGGAVKGGTDLAALSVLQGKSNKEALEDLQTGTKFGLGTGAIGRGIQEGAKAYGKHAIGLPKSLERFSKETLMPKLYPEGYQKGLFPTSIKAHEAEAARNIDNAMATARAHVGSVGGASDAPLPGLTETFERNINRGAPVLNTTDGKAQKLKTLPVFDRTKTPLALRHGVAPTETPDVKYMRGIVDTLDTINPKSRIIDNPAFKQASENLKKELKAVKDPGVRQQLKQQVLPPKRITVLIPEKANIRGVETEVSKKIVGKPGEQAVVPGTGYAPMENYLNQLFKAQPHVIPAEAKKDAANPTTVIRGYRLLSDFIHKNLDKDIKYATQTGNSVALNNLMTTKQSLKEAESGELLKEVLSQLGGQKNMRSSTRAEALSMANIPSVAFSNAPAAFGTALAGFGPNVTRWAHFYASKIPGFGKYLAQLNNTSEEK
jgi:hypothetical protein